MERRVQEKGQALIVVALAAIGLFAFAALAIDGSRVFSDKRHAQNAADTAALAGGLAHARGKSIAEVQDTAKARATSNDYDDGASNDITVTITDTPPGACAGTGKDITVTIVSYVPTTFARVVGRAQVTNAVTATARSCDVDVQGGIPLYDHISVMTLNTNSCNGRPTKNLYVGGSGHLQLYGGGMGSASADGGCVDFSGGETQLKKEDPYCGDLLTAASSIQGNNLNKLYDPDNCSDVVYNAAFEPPLPDLGITCSTPATQSGNTLSPGNWDTSTISPGSISTLQPGTYCVTGEIHLTGGTLAGTGVTLVMLNGRFKMTGSSQMAITAPTSNYDSFGNYTKGLLIYYPPSNSSDLHMEGSSNGNLSGTILAQSSNCYFTGSEQIQKAKLQFICDTWQMNGSGQGELVWDSTVFYAPTTTISPAISVLK